VTTGGVARPYEPIGGGIRVHVRLTPRGGRDAIGGLEELADGRSVLKARVRAAPEKGQANAALAELLAKALATPKSKVSVVAGATSRVKTVEVLGDPARLTRMMEELLCD
jgi:uncharacterized protein YggU (UPF0235/DUF167 family)